MAPEQTLGYAGEYRSAIARAKRVLAKAGIPWSVTTGRYQPFFNPQKTTKGVRVTRIGVSETVHMSAWGFTHSVEESRDLERRALEALRTAGLPFDDRGWLACGRDAVRLAARGEETSR